MNRRVCILLVLATITFGPVHGKDDDVVESTKGRMAELVVKDGAVYSFAFSVPPEQSTLTRVELNKYWQEMYSHFNVKRLKKLANPDLSNPTEQKYFATTLGGLAEADHKIKLIKYLTDRIYLGLRKDSHSEEVMPFLHELQKGKWSRSVAPGRFSIKGIALVLFEGDSPRFVVDATEDRMLRDYGKREIQIVELHLDEQGRIQDVEYFVCKRNAEMNKLISPIWDRLQIGAWAEEGMEQLKTLPRAIYYLPAGMKKGICPIDLDLRKRYLQVWIAACNESLQKYDIRIRQYTKALANKPPVNTKSELVMLLKSYTDARSRRERQIVELEKRIDEIGKAEGKSVNAEKDTP